MRVFVKNSRNESLMPCSLRKARILLKEHKAKIIQLTIATGQTVQPVNLGVDTGAKVVGVAISSGDIILGQKTK